MRADEPCTTRHQRAAPVRRHARNLPAHPFTRRLQIPYLGGLRARSTTAKMRKWSGPSRPHRGKGERRMMSRGALGLTLATCALLLASGASAATPQQIYRDLADNGWLDRKYAQADLDRALRNP